MARSLRIPEYDAQIEEGASSDALEEQVARRALVSQAPGRGRRGRIIATGAGAFIALALMVVLVASRRHPAVQADVTSEVGLDGIAFASMLATGLSAAAEMSTDFKKSSKELQMLMHPLAKIKLDVSKEVAPVPVDVRNVTYKASKPKENRKDGNVCADDEEEHAGLCYKTCSLLTAGSHPIRTTAWSCCREEPCSYFNSKFTNPLNVCGGFDRAGDAEGKGCPHQPGACLKNEELLLGTCYKKCAILTNNAYPHRTAAGSCCRYQNALACLDPTNLLTDPAYEVGGLSGHKLKKLANLAQAHAPLAHLTERGAGTTAAPTLEPMAPPRMALAARWLVPRAV